MHPYRQMLPARTPARRPQPQPADYREKLLASVDKLPPLPSVLNQLLRVLNNDNCSSGEIAAMIEKDSVLSGSVLRNVNSAYYGLPNRVSSIRHAVTLLGFGAVRNLALAFSMRQMLGGSRSSAKLAALYSQHSLGCAIMTQFLAHYARSEDVEPAFAAGLFHDVGRLLVINVLPRVLPDVVERWEQGAECLEASEQDLLGVSHSELSAAVLEKWRLPQDVQDAVRFHHDPDSFPASPEAELSLAHLVNAADLYVNFYGLETITSAKRSPAAPDEAFERIGLVRVLPELLERFKIEFQSIRGIFD